MIFFCGDSYRDGKPPKEYGPCHTICRPYDRVSQESSYKGKLGRYLHNFHLNAVCFPFFHCFPDIFSFLTFCAVQMDGGDQPHQMEGGSAPPPNTHTLFLGSYCKGPFACLILSSKATFEKNDKSLFLQKEAFLMVHSEDP